MVTTAILSTLVIFLFRIDSTARDDGSVVVRDVEPGGCERSHALHQLASTPLAIA
jgi:hypothetical protein